MLVRATAMTALSARLSAHRLIGWWLLATAPLLAIPASLSIPRLALLALHLTAGVLLLRWTAAPPSRRLSRLGAHLRDWLPLVMVFFFYWEVPLLAEGLHGDATYDPVVQGWEAWMFRGQPSQTLAGAWPWLALSELLHGAYLSYYAIILLPPLALYLAGRRASFRRLVFTVVMVVLVHQAAFIAFPVLGPRYLFPAPAGGIETGPLYRLTHLVLESASSPGTAFPSSHVGVAVAITLVLFRERVRAAPWVAGLTALLALSTVYGGFHYAVDAVAGVAVGAGVAMAAPGVRRALATRRPKAQGLVPPGLEGAESARNAARGAA